MMRIAAAALVADERLPGRLQPGGTGFGVDSGNFLVLELGVEHDLQHGHLVRASGLALILQRFDIEIRVEQRTGCIAELRPRARTENVSLGARVLREIDSVVGERLRA